MEILEGGILTHVRRGAAAQRAQTTSFTLRYGMATNLRLVPASSPAGQRIAEGIRKQHQIIAAFKVAALQTIREQRANERRTK